MNNQEAIGVATTQAGAGTTIWGWLVSSEAGILAGILIGVLGLLIQWYFHRRRDKREQAEHEAHMRALK